MKKTTQVLLTLTIAVVTGMALLLAGMPGTQTADASSHREAPLIAGDPAADNTDLYAFRSPDRPDSVTLLANFIPLEEPGGGPNYFKFDDNVVYQIRLDNNGDAGLDLALQFRFRTTVQNPDTFLYATGPITSLTDPDFNVRQVMDVTARIRQGSTFNVFTIGTGLPTPPVNVGPRSTPNYEALAESAISTVSTGAGDIKLFAGQRDEGFYIDLGSIFDLLGLRPFNTAHAIARPTAPGVDLTAGYNVHTIAVQIPTRLLTSDGQLPTSASSPNAVIGFYATASRPGTRVLNTNGTQTNTGDCSVAQAPSADCVQISRLANPLFNELFIPQGDPRTSSNDKDLYNAELPGADSKRLDYIQGTTARPVEPVNLINLLYAAVLDAPTNGRADLVQVFLTGVPGLNKSTANDTPPADLLRLNVAISPVAIGAPGYSRLGVIAGDLGGYPNGRRVGDDVVDISLRVAAGVLLPGNACQNGTQSCNQAPNNQLSDGVSQNDKMFRTTFPYLASPWDGVTNPYHGRECSTDPNAACPATSATPRP